MLTYDKAPTGAVLRARQLRRAPTDAEKKLWRALRSKLPTWKWRRQMPVGPYFVDFACFSEKLIIELDGGQHADAAAYDDRRTAYPKAQGYRVIRSWNHDVLSNTYGVLEQISLSLGRAKEPSEGRRKGEAVRPLPANSTSPSQASGLGPSLSHGRGEAVES